MSRDDQELLLEHMTWNEAQAAQDAERVLIIPIGGGGLIAGNAIAARGLKPSIEIVGVETTLYPSMWNALHNGDRPCGGATLAEGIAVSKAGGLTVPIVRELVSDIVLVEEVLIERARVLHPDQTFGAEFPSRFRKG